jgi:type I restriction enzyme S subunit
MKDNTRYKFSDVFELQMGKTPDRKNMEFWNGGNNVWASIGDMGNGKYISQSKELITDNAVSCSQIKMVPRDTVIMSFKLSIGKVCITSVDLYTNEAIMAFINKGQLDICNDYLYYLLQCYKWNGNRAAMGMTINKAIIGESQFSVPPLPVQQRIVSHLDKINEIIDKLRDTLNVLNKAEQAIFYDMFGDPVENEKGWETTKLNEIALIGDGLHGTPLYDDNGICYFINGNNLREGEIVFTDSTLRVDDTEKDKYFIPFNDNTILISINGTVGNIAYYNNENIILGKSACYINLERNIDKRYIFSLLKSDYFKHYALGEATGSTIKNVSLKTMRNFLVPVPPLSLQQSFASRIEVIEAQKQKIQTSIDKFQEMLNGAMDNYFGD